MPVMETWMATRPKNSNVIQFPVPARLAIVVAVDIDPEEDPDELAELILSHDAPSFQLLSAEWLSP